MDEGASHRTGKQSISRLRRWILTSLPLYAGAFVLPAHANTTDTDSAAKSSMEEIVVTAQKREEKLSHVPISITALGRTQMDKQGVRDVKDIARLVPGLQLQTTDERGDTNISIRGIQSNTGAETTGIYIDETPVQARQEIVASNPYPKVFDLDRLEVLRGPQGTLFGAGSEGGTVRFITPAPSLTTYSGYFRSELAFTDGGSPSYELGGAVGGPIVTDKLGFRASLWDRFDGGYIDRVDPVTDDLATKNANSSNSTVARLAFALQPIPGLMITPALFYQRVHDADKDYSWEDAPPFSTVQPAPPFSDYAQIAQPHTDTFILPSLDVAYDFGAFNVKSITSYFRRASDDRFDATAYELSGLLPNNAIVIPGIPNYLSVGTYQERQHDWTEEVRFASDDRPDSMFSWTVGGYYQHNQSGDQNTFAEPFDEASNYLSVIGGYGPGNSLSYFGEAPVGGKYSYLQNISVVEQDLAAFGNLTYQPIPGLKFSAGLRVARSKYSYSDFQDGPYGPGAPTSYGGGKSETPVTPRFSISYQLLPTEMIYATVAKGYRIGGANESVAGIVSCEGDLAALNKTDVPHTFNSDHVWSYEVGSKGSYFADQLRVDASLFWVNWSGIQQQVLLPDCGYYFTDNLGKAVSRGFDLQAEWLAGHGLTLSGTTGFTDAHYTNTVTEGGNILVNAGQALPSPLWTFTAAAEEDVALPSEANGYARVDDQFSGSYYRSGNASTFSYNPYTRDAPRTNFVTLRAGWKRQGWDVSVFIDNVTNTHVSLYRYEDVVGSPGLRDITFRPLTAGITAIKKF
jgi:outer membrane receptor protein involved in Fe transport